VVDEHGRGAGRARLWLRFGLASLSWLPVGLGFWISLADRERRTLHDRLSGSRLVRLPHRR
jgi:uncharacterized RDD family membrane protein YckC